MILGTFRCILKMDDCKVEDKMKAFHVPFLAVALLKSDGEVDKIRLGKIRLGRKVAEILNVQSTFAIHTDIIVSCGERLLAGGVCVETGMGGLRIFDTLDDFEKEYRIIVPHEYGSAK